MPPGRLDQLDLVHGLREAQRRGKGHTDQPLWPWSRMTAWRQVKGVMAAAGIPSRPAPHAQGPAPRLRRPRHRLSGVPLNMLSQVVGHATLEVTAIHANALGAEEQGIAARMWS